jgi:FtsZ-binding cell division protein ZapB
MLSCTHTLTHTHTHIHTYTHSQTRAHARTHARTRARALARAHTHAHTQVHVTPSLLQLELQALSERGGRLLIDLAEDALEANHDLERRLEELEEENRNAQVSFG